MTSTSVQISNGNSTDSESGSDSFSSRPRERFRAIQTGSASDGTTPVTPDIPLDLPDLSELIAKSRDGLIRGVFRTVTEKGGTEAAAGVSDFLFLHGANIEGMYGASMGSAYGQFTLFAASPDSMDEILESYQSELPDLPSDLVMTEKCDFPKKDQVLGLSLYAFDRQGIVAKVARVIADDSASILSAAGTSYTLAIVKDVPLFVLMMKIHVPETSRLQPLRSNLNRLADENGWDLNFDGTDE